MIGFLNIDKPVGMTSAQVVATVKKRLGLTKGTKIGHMGTLDKQAGGVLPIAVGRATRLFEYMLSKRKYYRAEFTFGYMTDSLDSAGEVVARDECTISAAQVRAVLPEFLGKIEQVPPLFSAKNVGGRRASDIVRSGEEVSLKPCKIEIFRFELVDNPRENTFVFDIECSAGTYIRSLCRDLAGKLNTVATMTALERTKAGVFEIAHAIPLDAVDETRLEPAWVVLGDMERIEFDTDAELKVLLNGQRLVLDKPEGLYAFFVGGDLRGLCQIDSDKLAKMKVWL